MPNLPRNCDSHMFKKKKGWLILVLATLIACTTVVLIFQKRSVSSSIFVDSGAETLDSLLSDSVNSSAITQLSETDSMETPIGEIQKREQQKHGNRAKRETEQAMPDKTLVVSDTVAIPEKATVGKALKYTDLPVNRSDVYAREHIFKMYKSFGHNDYILGEELALYYKNRAQGRPVVNKLIATFVKNNIVRITRQENGLVAQTVKEEGINNHFKIPMIMDLSLALQNNASIKIDPEITSREPLFRNCILLPLEMKGVTIVHESDTMPRKGYVNGDFLFVDYPGSKLAYKIKN